MQYTKGYCFDAVGLCFRFESPCSLKIRVEIGRSAFFRRTTVRTFVVNNNKTTTTKNTRNIALHLKQIKKVCCYIILVFLNETHQSETKKVEALDCRRTYFDGGRQENHNKSGPCNHADKRTNEILSR